MASVLRLPYWVAMALKAQHWEATVLKAPHWAATVTNSATAKLHRLWLSTILPRRSTMQSLKLAATEVAPQDTVLAMLFATLLPTVAPLLKLATMLAVRLPYKTSELASVPAAALA